MSFSFVAYDGPEIPVDPNVRKLIRRQAMKVAGIERKKKRTHGQHNLGQYPRFLEGSDHTENISNPENGLPLNVKSYSGQDLVSSEQAQLIDVGTEQRKNQLAKVLSHAAFRSPIARLHPDLIIPESFSIFLHLTPLTGLRLGIAQLGHSDPGDDGPRDSLFLPPLGSRKLLSFIPSRYGHVPALSHATDCIVAKLQQVAHPPDSRLAIEGEATVLLHYTKALKALQAALNDETQAMTAETLCATELLGIFEVGAALAGPWTIECAITEQYPSIVQLLNGSSHEGLLWLRHAGGAAQLIKARGAHRFQTEFEMSLFMAHLGPTVSLI
jgi:hypothetical protein